MQATPRKIPLTKPSLGEEEATAVRATILSEWIGQGPQVAAFEQEFAAYVGSTFACAVSSGTAALHLALHALGMRSGDEVITVSHSHIGTANAVRYCGARPVFVDIEPRTYNIDPVLIGSAITSRTKAILPVHQLGLPCAMGPILDLAEEYGLTVVEDASCALGSEIHLDDRWERIGRPRGRVCCFSFDSRNVLTTGDGGMLTTNDPELDAKFRLLRQQGMRLVNGRRDPSEKVLFEEYPVVGFNYRLTDLQAALGRVQLKRLPDFLAERIALAERYSRSLEKIDGLSPPHVPAYARTNYQAYAVRVGPGYPVTRNRLIQKLVEHGIDTRRGIMNAHQEMAYAGLPCGALPHSEVARDTTILLPLYSSMSVEDQDRIIEQLRQPNRLMAMA